VTIPSGKKLGRYEIRSQIGAGGMGEVYLALDAKLDRRVALKILPAELAANQDRMRRFVQEAKAAAALNHPNIAHIYEIGESEGTNFIAMEFIDGETLREKAHPGKSELKVLLKFLHQVAQGLAKAHASGIVHRDLKPDNIMITRDGHAKILDFGLAKLIMSEPPAVAGGLNLNDNLSATADGSDKAEEATAMMPVQHSTPGVVMGTVGYMSPEQAQAKPVDQRSDIFSFGCLLYEAATGRRPFAGDSVVDTLHKIIHDPAPAITDFNPSASPELQRVIRKCLAKEPEKRYQTIRDTANDLEELIEEMKGVSDIERSVAPSTSAITSGATKSTDDDRRGESTASGTHPPASSAEYVVAGIKQHKLAVAAIALALLVGGVALIAFILRGRITNAAIQSIAVMPFVNESGNADVEYLSDGMTESLITSLSQLPNLNVKARSTVFRYKGKATDAKTIGKDLNVQAILNGRVVQRGEQLTLSLELIDAQTENVIWSDKYERKHTDLVSLQNEIARDVSSKLKLKLSGAEQQKLAKSYTTDSEAYRLYLQGRFYLNKRVGNEFDKAEGYFQQAIAKDPNFALGYVGLAEFISERDRPKAKEYIMRALALDNQLSDAHATLGYQLMLDYDFAASERELKRAIELDPNNGRAYQWNGWRLMMMGLYDQALASFDRAIEIEPTRADIRNNRGACLVAAGRIDDGIAEIKKSMELDPTFPWAHSHISYVYRMRGDHAAAVEERARAFELLDRADQATRMRESFAKSGWTGYLRDIVSQDWGRLGTSQTRRASLLAELGEKEAAMARLNEAATKGDSWLFSIKYDPAFDPLRDDPRFKEVLKRLNLPE